MDLEGDSFADMVGERQAVDREKAEGRTLKEGEKDDGSRGEDGKGETMCNRITKDRVESVDLESGRDEKEYR